MKSITLHYRQGSSDKIYQAAIQPKDGLFVVTFAYGRRGTTLQTGTKTPVPVDYPSAEKLFNRLVGEKQAKGYTEAPDGTPYQHTDKLVTDILPQLLNSIEEAEVNQLLRDKKWCLQEKFDGRRILLRKQGQEIHGINRKGILTGLPRPVVLDAQLLAGDFIVDGECVGDQMFLFDLLELEGRDCRPWPYYERWEYLRQLIEEEEASNLWLIESASEPRHKLQLFNELKRHNSEGAVFKQLDAPYAPGRPNSGGPALKFKFTSTASLIVAMVNEQRSVALRLFDSTNNGNVTIPPNQPIPAVGSVVEVRYLYAFEGSGCLFQPVYLGERDDLEPTDCLLNQLKFKADPIEEEVP
jgi:bifunctional non-homologous end joining protein LigD